METMTKTGVELIHDIIEISRNVADIIHGETITQLRDELAKCQAELATAKSEHDGDCACFDNVCTLFDRGVGYSELYDAIKELKQRAERAEKDLEKQIVINQTCHGLVRGNPCKNYGELSSATVNDVADLVQTLQRVIKERDEALAKQ
jgi:hypothetical protein